MVYDMVEGTMRWKVDSMTISSGTGQITLRQEFSGYLTRPHPGSGILRDTTLIPLDVNYAHISEDANHVVTVTSYATGVYATCGGNPATFQSFPPDAVDDTLLVTKNPDIGSGWRVKAKWNFGLVYYESWAGGGMSGVNMTMIRQ
jgi:hypothetical protein